MNHEFYSVSVSDYIKHEGKFIDFYADGSTRQAVIRRTLGVEAMAEALERIAWYMGGDDRKDFGTLECYEREDGHHVCPFCFKSYKLGRNWGTHVRKVHRIEPSMMWPLNREQADAC